MSCVRSYRSVGGAGGLVHTAPRFRCADHCDERRMLTGNDPTPPPPSARFVCLSFFGGLVSARHPRCVPCGLPVAAGGVPPGCDVSFWCARTVVALRAQSSRDNDGFLGCLAVVGPMSLYGFVTNTHLKFIIALRSSGPHDYKDSTVKAVRLSGWMGGCLTRFARARCVCISSSLGEAGCSGCIVSMCVAPLADGVSAVTDERPVSPHLLCYLAGSARFPTGVAMSYALPSCSAARACSAARVCRTALVPPSTPPSPPPAPGVSPPAVVTLFVCVYDAAPSTALPQAPRRGYWRLPQPLHPPRRAHRVGGL